MAAPDADVIVLGAGPAGLGAAHALGEHALVLERSRHAGGLAASLEVGGAHFDLGGHSFHTPHPAVRKLVFDALPMEEQTRNAWCFVHGEWLPYPYQKHFELLTDADVVADCREGLAEVDRARECANFDEFLTARFGPGIAQHFLRPYNAKLWGHDLTRLAADWTTERVAAPAGIAQPFETQGGQRRPLADDTRVAYPAHGGFGAIFQALAKQVSRLALEEGAGAIDPATNSLTTTQGRQLRYRELVSTLPLPRLLELLPEVPRELTAMVGRLVALPVTLVMVALDGRVDSDVHRVYVPGSIVPGHKIVLNNTSSQWLRSQQHHGIQVEVTDGEIARVGPDQLVESVVAGLVAIGLIDDPDRVTESRTLRLPYGYPVPTHERVAIMETARNWLAQRNISTLGRFGEWAYINSDEALARGLHWGAARANAASTLRAASGGA